MSRVRSTALLVRAALPLAAVLLASAAAAQSLNPSLQATRSRGVAPLAVLFDATGTQAASPSDDAFHDLHYSWDFDDPASGTWGPSGLPRNQAQGPLAGHVFETPGTYTVTLQVRDGAGRTATRTTSITVDPASSLQTVCFANDNSDWSDADGACQGAQRVVTSDFASAMGHVAPGKRLLLRRGDLFTLGGTVQLGGAGPVVIGAFGSGAAPIVRQTTGGNHIVFASVNDWRIMDLDLRGTASTGQSGSHYFQEAGASSNLTRVTLLRIQGSGQHAAMNFTAQWGIVAPIHDQVAVVDSVFRQFVRSGGKGSGVRIDARRSFYQGNQMLNNEGNEFNMRTQHLDKFVIAHNYFDRPGDQKGNLTIRACNWFKACGGTGNRGSATAGVGDTKEFIIADNTFRMRLRGVPLSINPQNKSSWEYIHTGIVERNYFVGMPNGGVQRGIKVHASNLSIRNNVLDSSEWWYDTQKQGVTRKAISVVRNSNVGIPDASNVRIHNNTHYDGSSWPGGTATVEVNSGSGHSIVNNLLYAPNLSSEVVASSAGTVRVQANRKEGSNPFAGSTLSSAQDFRLKAGAAPRDAGAPSNALVGFEGTRRPSGGQWDVGAFEFAVQGGGGAPAAPVLLP